MKRTIYIPIIAASLFATVAQAQPSTDQPTPAKTAEMPDGFANRDYSTALSLGNYTDRSIVTLHTKVKFTTIIVLPEKEKILDWICGDKTFWVVEGAENLAFIRPAEANINTNLSLVTASGRVYTFDLTEISSNPTLQPDQKVYIEPLKQIPTAAADAHKPRFVDAVELDKMKLLVASTVNNAQQEVEHRSRTAAETMQFNYDYQRNKKPFLVSSIYSDGRFTYIRSDAQEKPTIYEVKDGQPNLISFDLKGNVYIVDKVLDSGYLAIGKKRLEFKRK
jgi:type IV secretory pathway VirB9-like protein